MLFRSDILLAPQRLDLAAMKVHQFVTADSSAGSLVYRMSFADGDERKVPLPQPSLLSVRRKPWSRSKEELEEQLRLLGFYEQHPVAKQKTAYEILRSDWSSDVCSSDLSHLWRDYCCTYYKFFGAAC